MLFLRGGFSEIRFIVMAESEETTTIAESPTKDAYSFFGSGAAAGRPCHERRDDAVDGYFEVFVDPVEEALFRLMAFSRRKLCAAAVCAAAESLPSWTDD